MRLLNINNILFRQYELKVEDYLLNNENGQSLILLKPKFSRYTLEVTLTELMHNENYVIKIHPYDCYLIGILNRMLLENIIPNNKNIINISHNNEKIHPYIQFTGTDYAKHELTFEINQSRTKYHISVSDFLKNPHIIRAISSSDSLQLGFTITDMLISNGELNNI